MASTRRTNSCLLLLVPFDQQLNNQRSRTLSLKNYVSEITDDDVLENTLRALVKRALSPEIDSSCCKVNVTTCVMKKIHEKKEVGRVMIVLKDFAEMCVL